jgi:aryl-alcohol dehydrogenase-like predicted oxidoreductase
MEYSLVSRSIETAVLPTCRRLGIGVTAYGVLSRGLLSSAANARRYAAGQDFRVYSPRFQGDNLAANLALITAFEDLARSLRASPAELALAWVFAQGTDIVPLIGARKRAQLTEALTALARSFAARDLDAAAQIFAGTVAGERYNAHGMMMLDSEKA